MRRLMTLSLVAAMVALTLAPAQAQYRQGWRDTGNANTSAQSQYNYGWRDTGNANTFDQSQYRRGWRNSGYGNIDNTQARLQARISRGIADGRLNSREASRLQAKLTQISDLEARMRASGNRLTSKERSRLMNQLNNLSNQVTRDLSDFERRPGNFWNGRR